MHGAPLLAAVVRPWRASPRPAKVKLLRRHVLPLPLPVGVKLSRGRLTAAATTRGRVHEVGDL